MNVSLEAGLWSFTLVRSKGGTPDAAYASSGIHVRVLVDGVLADPGEIVFARRAQALTAVFSGIFQSCTDANANGVITGDECQFSNEELSLLLNTMAANSFNFVLSDVGVGNHSVVVQARIENSASAQSGDAVAKAMIGKGSITVEEVRMVKGSSIFQF